MANDDTSGGETGGRMFYALDENGEKQDAFIHEPILDNVDADLLFQLHVIRDHVQDGHSLESGVALFGDESMERAYAAGQFGIEDINETLLEAGVSD